MSGPTIAAWFERDLPPALTSPSLIVGGTHLLDEFFAAAFGGAGPSSLTIAVPFLDRAMVDVLCSLINSAKERTSLSLLSTPGSCQGEAIWPLKSLTQPTRIWAVRELHSKVFVSRTDDNRGAALIGSHNLTEAGRRGNHEVGVLFVGTDASTHQAIDSIEDYTSRLKRCGKLVYSSECTLSAASAA